MTITLYAGNDGEVVAHLTSKDDGTPLQYGVVTVSVREAVGTSVLESATMAHHGEGYWKAILPGSSILRGARYKVVVSVTVGGRTQTFSSRAPAVRRRA